VGFVVKKVALGQVFPEYFGFPCHFHFTGVPLQGNMKNKIFIIITGLYNKPQGCGKSAASAAGPFTTQKCHQRHDVHKTFDMITKTYGGKDGQTLCPHSPLSYKDLSFTFAVPFRIAEKWGGGHKHDASPWLSFRQNSRILTDRRS
jgi:hypothetical protein